MQGACFREGTLAWVSFWSSSPLPALMVCVGSELGKEPCASHLPQEPVHLVSLPR